MSSAFELTKAEIWFIVSYRQLDSAIEDHVIFVIVVKQGVTN